MSEVVKYINLDDTNLVSVFGANDSLLNLIESAFESTIFVRGNQIVITGDEKEVNVLDSIFKELVYMLKKNGVLNDSDVKTVIQLTTLNKSNLETFSFKNDDNVIYKGFKNQIRTKTKTQAEYFHKVKNNDVVFSIGPAGTGKTFLAVAMALRELKLNEVKRIVLTRPAVEAGESLGFLPGDLQEKIDPYLRPLTDALQYMLSPEKYKIMKERNIIEINPLAYMRGRTLNNAFVILDEAQNSTETQMKMFLTRLGIGSKAIITGDTTQIDLPRNKKSGLVSAQRILKKIDGIEFVYFSEHDVVRHRLVAEIIKAYDKDLTEK
ncbi:MAG: PhoH family protein [Candidatus Kapaibacterium sp.]|nr:PhoH family protein [Ignavibacteriota bacterium]